MALLLLAAGQRAQAQDTPVAGGTLQLVMGPQPNRAFGTAPAHRPQEVY